MNYARSFNRMGRKVSSFLENLGASHICKPGNSDSASRTKSVDTQFQEWQIEHLLPALKQHGEWSDEEKQPTWSERLTKVRGELKLCAKMSKDHETTEKLPRDTAVLGNGRGCDDYNNFITRVKVSETTELLKNTGGTRRSTKKVVFDIGEGSYYEPAGTLEVMPQNPAWTVDYFMHQFGLATDEVMSWVKNPDCLSEVVPAVFPTPISMKDALARFVDLVNIPDAGTLLKFAVFFRDEDADDRENLIKLINSPAFNEASSPQVHMSFAEFWHMFLTGLMKNPEFDVGVFLQLCPGLKPKPYTISSSPSENRRMLTITVGLVERDVPSRDSYKQKLADLRVVYNDKEFDLRWQGYSSLYLTSLTQGDPVAVSVRKSDFSKSFSKNQKNPIVMIGTGTGVAPFRAMLMDIASWQDSARPTTMLLFGCHNRDSYLYGDEFVSLQKNGILNHLELAFSREQHHQRVYVQDKVEEQSDLIRELVCKKEGTIYVCGSRAVGDAVLNALQKIVGKENIQLLRDNERYVEEIFG